MTTKKAAKQATRSTPPTVTIHHATNLSPETRSALQETAQAAAEAMAATAPGRIEHLPEPRRRSRRSREEELPDVDLPAELLADPNRMNFMLLLALLSKGNGQAEFNQQDLDFDDSAYNIAFARSINGKKVVVSVVSAQSGIIRTPAAEPRREPEWRTPSRNLQYQAPPAPELIENDPPAGFEDRAKMLQATAGEMTPQERFLQQHQQASQPDPSTSYPFEVGDAPQTARPMDLGALAAQASRADQIAAEQAEAAARVERQGH